MGGPKSEYYNGWYSELPIEPDNFNFSDYMGDEEILREILKRIEEKTVPYHREILTFNEDKWLTPAIWLDVPDDWKNKCNA